MFILYYDMFLIFLLKKRNCKKKTINFYSRFIFIYLGYKQKSKGFDKSIIIPIIKINKIIIL